MKIALGSENEPKRRAVLRAFEEVYDEPVEVEAIAADSGVSSHPTSIEESIQGAINRAEAARKTIPGANYYIGIEGGLLKSSGRVWEIGYVAIQNSLGETHTGLSGGIELGGVLLKAILEGTELSTALNQNFGIPDVGQSNGYYGLLTDNIVTREDAYVDAIIFAISPFKNPKFYN